MKNIGMRCIKYAVAAVICLSLLNCKSKKVELPFGDFDIVPTQSVYNAVSSFTEEGRIQMKTKSPIMYNYTEEEIQVFPKGVNSTFFSNQGDENVDIVADSAINMQKDQLMKFYGNVIIKDYRNGDTLYTEALYWNQQTKKIYSNVHVRKISPGLILEGDGFDSDEQMNNVQLIKPRGVIL